MKSGWVTNKGEIIECKVFEHFDADNDIIQSIWREYENKLDDISSDCNFLIDTGEHPEWHNYEIAEDEFKYEATHRLYKMGFLRLGNYGTQIAVSGYEEWIEQHKYVLKKLSDKYECKLSIIKEKFKLNNNF